MIGLSARDGSLWLRDVVGLQRGAAGREFFDLPGRFHWIFKGKIFLFGFLVRLPGF
jgi:hypothetical protein